MVATEKQKKNLRPAKKGEVRNPRGRGKGVPNFKTIYEKLLKGEIKVKVSGRVVKRTRREAIAAMKIRDALNDSLNPIDRLRAADSIENRVEGKPEQPLSAVKVADVHITFDKDDADL